MTAPKLEVWQRGPVAGVPALLQPAAHAMLQAREELEAIARGLTTEQLWARPAGVAAVGFHVAHVAGVLDRLLTYARGESLSREQRVALGAEPEPGDPPRDAAALLDALARAVDRALDQLRATDPATLVEPRELGRLKIPTTVGGLLFHAAEHAQRHVGQALVTARVASGGA
ncbi:DinB-like domain protein [Gemmatirosa kalamazoonensis]|uniref:DinB-like domain protein n=1 Tax=Gemmatirosa kalamazoonensis TaxID=861299 RepID=W0RFC5_9BACT|nr:DinB family protein [Gemmatirosa kalamazoonensis]AHG89040.1 DinB-like domain protein [Gemmatirosa kalamazoonensis]